MAAIFTPTIRLSSIYKVFCFFCVHTIYKDFPESTRDEENEKVEEWENQYGCKQKQASNSVRENI